MNTLRWDLFRLPELMPKVIPAINISKRSTLAAVASRNLEKAVQVPSEWSIPLAFDSHGRHACFR